jgi:hypothetical protein
MQLRSLGWLLWRLRRCWDEVLTKPLLRSILLGGILLGVMLWRDKLLTIPRRQLLGGMLWRELLSVPRCLRLRSPLLRKVIG